MSENVEIVVKYEPFFASKSRAVEDADKSVNKNVVFFKWRSTE